MKDQFERREQRPCVEPADPVEMLFYKESLDESSILKTRCRSHGSPRSLAEAARDSLARWHLAARIWLHRLITRI